MKRLTQHKLFVAVLSIIFIWAMWRYAITMSRRDLAPLVAMYVFGDDKAMDGEGVMPVTWQTWVWFGLFIVGTFMSVWSYIQCVITDPGRVPKMFEFASTQDDGDECTPMQFITTSQPCMVCACYKPPRTHHCSTCERCVLKYDHHCPWIANCIGWKNTKHFLLFLFYITVHLTIVTFGMGKQMYLALMYYYAGHPDWPGSKFVYHTAVKFKHMPSLQKSIPTMTEVLRWDNAAVFWLAFIASTYSMYMLRKQWRLARSNKTTIEVVLNSTENYDSPYDMGVDHNMKAVFGTKGGILRRWLPVDPQWDAAPVPPKPSSYGYGATATRTSDARSRDRSEYDEPDAFGDKEGPIQQWLEASGAAFESKPVGFADTSHDAI